MSHDTHATACPLDCPDTCSLAVAVDAGKLVSVDASDQNPYTQGFICGKVRNIGRHVYGKDRLLHPLIRDGKKGEGTFRQASWDEALDLIAARIMDVRKRRGGEAIVPCNYGGSNGALSDGCVDERFFRRLGASRLARDICARPTGRAAEGVHGRMLGTALDDYAHSNLIVVWGANPASSGIHLVPVVKDAQKRGAKLVVVDPRRTGMATHADLHVGLRPGTDLPVALAIANWLFENGHADLDFLAEHATGVDEFRAKASAWTLASAAEVAGVDESDLLTLATWFAASSPAVLRCGWGLERNRNGGSAVAAVIALPAIAGKFGVRGGGLTMSNSRAIPLDRESVINADVPDTRTISQKEIGRALLEEGPGALDVFFVYNANILATAPAQEAVRRGMEREDLFSVVFDQVMTDTALYADVVLPATTFLEHHDVRVAYGPFTILDVRPVIDPVGESRSNLDVFSDLIRRCGLEEEGDVNDPDALRAGLLSGDPALLHDLREFGIARPERHHPVGFVDAFPATPDGKYRLHPDDLDQESGGLYVYKPDPATEAHPLSLITPSTPERVTSTFGQLHDHQVPLEMHPDDLASRGLVDGDRVRAFNHIGEMHCTVVGNADLPRGVTSQPKGLWARNTECGRTGNALCPDTAADLGGGACYNDARIQVEKLR